MKRMIVALLCFFASAVIAIPATADDYHGNYRGQRGYKERPYNRHRDYGPYDYRGHKYGYRGHWRSWDDWNRYARQNPYLYKYGRYYREGGHLMFRVCEPGSGCFFFSIGR